MRHAGRHLTGCCAHRGPGRSGERCAGAGAAGPFRQPGAGDCAADLPPARRRRAGRGRAARARGGAARPSGGGPCRAPRRVCRRHRPGREQQGVRPAGGAAHPAGPGGQPAPAARGSQPRRAAAPRRRVHGAPDLRARAGGLCGARRGGERARAGFLPREPPSAAADARRGVRGRDAGHRARTRRARCARGRGAGRGAPGLAGAVDRAQSLPRDPRELGRLRHGRALGHRLVGQPALPLAHEAAAARAARRPGGRDGDARGPGRGCGFRGGRAARADAPGAAGPGRGGGLRACPDRRAGTGVAVAGAADAVVLGGDRGRGRGDAAALGRGAGGADGARVVAGPHPCPAERDPAPQRRAAAARPGRAGGGPVAAPGAARGDGCCARRRDARAARFRRNARGAVERGAPDDAGGADRQARRCVLAGPFPHRGDGERLHAARGALARPVVRRGEARRDQPLVRDLGRAGRGREGAGGGPAQPSLPRLRARHGAAVPAVRLLGQRPLRGAALRPAT